MRHQLRYGTGQIEFSSGRSKLTSSFRGTESEPIRDVETATREQLAEPLNAPPLHRSVVPGDKVAIVLDSGIPSPSQLLIPILEELARGEVAPADVSILLTPGGGEDFAEQLAELLPDSFAEATVLAHDPENDKDIAYLANTKNGQRIYLNRRVSEADAILAVGRIGADPLLGRRGTASDLFPGLTNSESRNRARIYAIDGAAAKGLRKRQLCDEVGWLAGLYHVAGVSLDRNNDVERVWFGEAAAVQKAGNSHVHDKWTVTRSSPPPDLVIATVSRGLWPVTWEAIGAALETAARLVRSDGNVLVIADVAEPPGAAVRWLADQDSPWDVLARLREPQSIILEDSLVASQCAHALSACKVHLYSKIDPELIESLSMTAVRSVKEIERLFERSDFYQVVEDADRVAIDTGEPEDDGASDDD